jgi:hypothetical protein
MRDVLLSFVHSLMSWISREKFGYEGSLDNAVYEVVVFYNKAGVPRS